MIAHTAEKACEWILREDVSTAPITVNVSAEMDDVALGGLITHVLENYKTKAMQAPEHLKKAMVEGEFSQSETNSAASLPNKVECTITRMELVPCNFGGVEFGYAAIDAKGKKYLLSHYGSDEVATAEVLRLAYSTMTSAGAVRLEDLIGRKILVAPSESNALLLPLEFA